MYLSRDVWSYISAWGKNPQKIVTIMRKSQSKMRKKVHFDKPVFRLMKKSIWEKCLKGIEEVMKYHDFPE